MDKYTTIKEGNIRRNYSPVNKLEIKTTEDKTSLWIPSEYENTGVLYASQNGIYIASEDGYAAYSEIIVRVTEESFYGDTDFDNWDYEVPTDFPDLWDQLTLDDFNIDPLAFDDLFNNKDKWETDNFSKKFIDILPKNVSLDKNKYKYKKQKIKGIDPNTNNWKMIGLDANGYLTEELVPTKLVIVVDPYKLSYHDKETIIFDGLVVKAFTEDDKLWTDEKHPDGIIPLDELIFPVTKADVDIADNIRYMESDLDLSTENGQSVIQPIPTADADYIKVHWDSDRDDHIDTRDITFSGSGIVGTARIYGDRFEDYIFATRNENNAILTEIDNTHYRMNGAWHDDTWTFHYGKNPGLYTYQGKTVKCLLGTASIPSVSEELKMTCNLDFTATYYPVAYYNDVYQKVCWTIVYGKKTAGVQRIPVQWENLAGDILEDGFMINVAYPNETLPTDNWNHHVDPSIDPHDIPETPEGEVNP